MDLIWPIQVVSGSEMCSLLSMPTMKLRLPKVNSLPGMKVMVLMLHGAIKLIEIILTTPLPGVPTVSVFYRQYNLWGGSSDHKPGGSTRCRKQDA